MSAEDSTFPNIHQVIAALCDRCLGSGQEVSVYKIDTNPDYTVQLSHDAPRISELKEYLLQTPFQIQPDIFEGRNYAQPLAFWHHPDIADDKTLLTINRYSPGFSIEIQKANMPQPDSEEALIKTRVWSERIANMPDSSFDILYDDLHYLSSRKHSIDVCTLGLFTNTGNILYSNRDQRAYIIDVQPFIQKPGIPKDHTKGFNTPLYLTRGLLPGAYCYTEEHSKDPELIEMRTEIIAKSIGAARRNDYNDIGGYLPGDETKMRGFWQVQLKKLHIPEETSNALINDVTSITHKQRYPTIQAPLKYRLVQAFHDYS